MAPRILTFSVAIGADYSDYVKSIATCAPTFFGYIISVLASVFSFIKFLRFFSQWIEKVRYKSLLWIIAKSSYVISFYFFFLKIWEKWKYFLWIMFNFNTYDLPALFSSPPMSDLESLNLVRFIIYFFFCQEKVIPSLYQKFYLVPQGNLLVST